MLSLLKILEEIESMESLFTSQWSSWTSVSRKASSASHVQSWTSLPPTRNTLLIISSCNLKSYIIYIIYRLEICQKIYTTRFSDQQFYTLKVHNLQLFLLKKKQRKCINLVAFLLEINWVRKILTVSVQNHSWCV